MNLPDIVRTKFHILRQLEVLDLSARCHPNIIIYNKI